MDAERFNKLAPRQQAQAIIEAAARARGRAAPKLDEPIKIEGDDTTMLAAAIVRAGRRARGEEC